MSFFYINVKNKNHVLKNFLKNFKKVLDIYFENDILINKITHETLFQTS